MGEAISNGGEFLGEGSVADNGFNNLPKESFEDFRARIENEEKFDESRFDLTPLEPDVDGFAETVEKSSIEGSSNNDEIDYNVFDNSFEGSPENEESFDEQEFDLTPLEPDVDGHNKVGESGLTGNNGFDGLPKESFEDFRARIENEEKFDESGFDLTPLEPDVDGFAETAENNSANNQFTSPVNGSRLENTETPGIMRSDYDDILYHVSKDGEVVPLQSPVNGSELVMTETPGIMRSDYDDILYHVSKDGEVVPLQSPINGSELVMTETPDIMKSEYDDILYHVSENGEITPLQSPINGNSLDIAGDGVFVDETTGQQFSLDDILNK